MNVDATSGSGLTPSVIGGGPGRPARRQRLGQGIRRMAARSVAAVGHPVVEASLAAYETLASFGESIAALPSLYRELGVLVERFLVLVVRCARLVALASFAAGAVMALQFGAGMGRFGATLYVPTVATTAIVEALAPMLAALMAASRSGGGLAAEIAGMAISQQLDAIKALGSDPVRKLYAPSLLTMTIGLPLLTVVAMLAGLAGAVAIETTALALPWSQVISKTLAAINLQAAALAALKTMVAGALIAVIAVREGRRAAGGTAGIGAATTAAVIRGTIAVLLADLVLTKLIWVIL